MYTRQGEPPLRDNPERGFFAAAIGGGSLTAGRVVLVVRVVPCIHDGFRIGLDDGPVAGFVLVVAAGLGVSLGLMCVLAGSAGRRQGVRGPRRACSSGLWRLTFNQAIGEGWVICLLS